MGSKTKLLVASLRNPEQFKNAIINGADVVTVPPQHYIRLIQTSIQN